MKTIPVVTKNYIGWIIRIVLRVVMITGYHEISVSKLAWLYFLTDVRLLYVSLFQSPLPASFSPIGLISTFPYHLEKILFIFRTLTT